MARARVLMTWLTLFVLADPAAMLAGGQQRSAGETAAEQPTADGRDRQLQQLAGEHARRGDWVTAMQTLSGVADRRALAGALREVATALDQAPQTGPAADNAAAIYRSGPGAADRNGSGDGRLPGGGPGGASFADFTPLMDLIQSTIAPDMWEQGGGTSTVRPYPGGILVDPDGLVTDITVGDTEDHDSLLSNIEVLLAQDPQDEQADREPTAEAWRLPARYRCVSLRGVSHQVLRHRLSGLPLDDALRHLAGLSRIQYVVLLPERHDVILVGPVGGIESHQGWVRDRRSGLPAMRLDFFAACAAAAYSQHALGCSIDPTPQSLVAAANVATAMRSGVIPLGLAENALREALGEQVIRVFGVAGDTPLAYLMVEADRHMKRLSLGQEPMPRGVANYLDMINKHIERGPPDGQLLRLWFTASPLAVRAGSNRQVYQLAGRPLKLSSETLLAGAGGERLASPADDRLVEFVDGFNQHFDEIVRAYPIYGALQSVYQAAAIAELLRRSDAHSWSGGLLAPLLLDDASAGVMSVPRRVESIATAHRVKHRGKRHFILLASGGVRIEPSAMLPTQFQNYPTIDALAPFAQPLEDPAQRWWWDAK